MEDLRVILRYVGLVLHGIAACVLLGLLSVTGLMTAFCLVPGVLAAFASVPAVRDRPITLYAAFGLLIGHSFWIMVSAVNQRQFVEFIPMILVVAGAVWLLKAPDWPSVIFTAVAILVSMLLAVWMLRNWREAVEPERLRASAVTTIGIMIVALAYVAVGFGEAYSVPRDGQPRNKKRRPRRAAEEV